MQAADSLTKSLKAGSDQKKARELLGLYDINSGQTGKTHDMPDRPRVSRVCVSNCTPGSQGSSSDNLLSVVFSARKTQGISNTCSAPSWIVSRAMEKTVCAEESVLSVLQDKTHDETTNDLTGMEDQS